MPGCKSWEEPRGQKQKKRQKGTDGGLLGLKNQTGRGKEAPGGPRPSSKEKGKTMTTSTTTSPAAVKNNGGEKSGEMDGLDRAQPRKKGENKKLGTSKGKSMERRPGVRGKGQRACTRRRKKQTVMLPTGMAGWSQTKKKKCKKTD